MRCSWLFASALAIALGTSGAVHAQAAPGGGSAPSATDPPPADAPTDQPKSPAETPLDELAAKHYEDGRSEAQKGNWKSAYTSFRAAYAIQTHHLILAALGEAALRVGNYREA